MTEKEWQDFYEITSLKGRIWKRSEIAKRAGDMLKSLLPGMSSSVRHDAVLIVLADPVFMRSRRGMIPARVISDVAVEAMLRMKQEVKP